MCLSNCGMWVKYSLSVSSVFGLNSRGKYLALLLLKAPAEQVMHSEFLELPDASKNNNTSKFTEQKDEQEAEICWQLCEVELRSQVSPVT